MTSICTDLHEELAALDAMVSPLTEAGWNTPTPAKGWTVRDQIIHLGGTDRVAVIAADDPERFNRDILAQDRAVRVARLQEEVRAMHNAALLAWWRTGYHTMIEVFRRLHPKARLPWFGPAMSAVSFATARLMETWAHGQDIVDALGLERAATKRLKHVAHIGVRARPFSYIIHGQQAADGRCPRRAARPRWRPVDLG